MPQFQIRARKQANYKTSGRRRPGRHHYLLGAACACLLSLLLFSVSSDPAPGGTIDLAHFAGGNVRALPVPPLEALESDGANTEQHGRFIELVVQPGDSLAALFERNKLSATDLHAIMQLGGDVEHLRRLQPGDRIRVEADKDGSVLSLTTDANSETRIDIAREDETDFRLASTELPVQRQVRVASGTIERSLYQAGYEAGLSDALIMNLANIFGWDIDFALDIRRGDQFRVIYEEIYRDGEKIRDGAILAASFFNDGRELHAVRFEDEEGRIAYYAPDGKPMRKEFLRAPLNFSYVSSGFNPKRFHPVLKRVKPHNGIDYRAPAGTPVYAAGDGKVIRSTYDKYNGNHVFIQHGQKYVTKYLHFTRRAAKVGERVKQGQVIGYVGSTGLSTAPHLHYEFLVNGVHRNPRTVKLPDVEPLPKEDLDRFLAISAPLLRQLELFEPGARVAVAP